MRYAVLGKTGLEVSAVSFGTAPLGDMFGAVDADSAVAALLTHPSLALIFVH